MTLKILSLAETDLLDGFRFYEWQAGRVGWYFLESLNSGIESLRLYAGTHRRILGYHRMLETISVRDLFMTCKMTKSEFGACWIAEAIRAGSSSR